MKNNSNASVLIEKISETLNELPEGDKFSENSRTLFHSNLQRINELSGTDTDTESAEPHPVLEGHSGSRESNVRNLQTIKLIPLPSNGLKCIA